jgi:hypothetical protein
MTVSRARSLLWAVPLLVLTLGPVRALATVRFLQNQTESTITQVLYPWTQDLACPCCICWETALGTILAYWDDYAFKGTGPWELLLPGGSGSNPAAFRAATQQLYQRAGIACKAGAPWGVPGISECNPDGEWMLRYTNDGLGYSFTYEEDSWVWFGSDIKASIDADQPLLYAYYPEGSGSHDVTIVGYDDADQTLFIYKNWYPVVTHKGFDEALNHCVAAFTPAGKALPPASWTCPASEFAGNDGCHCKCGAPDPDCESPGQKAYNCAPQQKCTAQGTCQSLCTDECVSNAQECVDRTQYRTCGDYDGDGCTEWNVAQTCAPGELCDKGACVVCDDECLQGQRRCVDLAHYQDCGDLSGEGCRRWSRTPSGCPPASHCLDGACVADACPTGTCSDPPPADDRAGCSCALGRGAGRDHGVLLALLLVAGLLVPRWTLATGHGQPGRGRARADPSGNLP